MLIVEESWSVVYGVWRSFGIGEAAVGSQLYKAMLVAEPGSKEAKYCSIFACVPWASHLKTVDFSRRVTVSTDGID